MIKQCYSCMHHCDVLLQPRGSNKRNVYDLLPAQHLTGSSSSLRRHNSISNIFLFSILPTTSHSNHPFFYAFLCETPFIFSPHQHIYFFRFYSLFRGFLPIFLPPPPRHYCPFLHIKLLCAGHGGLPQEGQREEPLLLVNTQVHFPSSFHRVGKKTKFREGGVMKERGNFVLLFWICLSLSIHPHFLEELGWGTIKRKDVQHG